MPTLLERAKEVKAFKTNTTVISEEQYELGVAWANSEISLRQMQKALNFKNVNSVYTFLASCFKYSVLNKK